ncbi:IS3 family transposase [Peptacetobacter hiranonis]|uniref:IS3 family transposase n=1 Tax=Peptacetobacter hiranonis TaxID=89152 RepID=UPI0019174574|nr:IS3 family transposase [Peptacetobacter hiranonis]QQQ85652.1 IS3 family transposase [Peptacetobacter hiranonis]QQQ85804.1 IS3 family transposase [Peptacetobacter hiranonis]QQQ86261.1 IS3 family transposase [Peptacetobacter hiranonis]QQQ86285.1 IS3 family transposase [Peptacetobacter hiranonis]
MQRVRNNYIYTAIKEVHEKHRYPISSLCKISNVSKSGYFKWLKHQKTYNDIRNEKIANIIEKIHSDYPDKGYRRIRDDLYRYYNINVNDKRILRICRVLQIKSTIKYKNNGCTIQNQHPTYTTENILNRNFKADAPDEKWLTDVSEFHYYVNGEKHRLYLSAILDLYDRRIVAYTIGDSNNTELVYNMFDFAVKNNPKAHPIFHSDRGYQYTNRTFHSKLVAAGMTQSMSRIARCIDNGPMEGFWGIIKRERYYGKKFNSRKELVDMIENYINYYNNSRLQRKLGVLTPFEKHEEFLKVA